MDSQIYLSDKIEFIKAQIQFYDTSYKICIVGFLIFMVLTIFLYFSLHIGNAFCYITGIQKLKEIGKFRQNTKVSGNLAGEYMKGYPFIVSENDCDEPTEKLTIEEESTVLLTEIQQDAEFHEDEFVIQENVFSGCKGMWID